MNPSTSPLPPSESLDGNGLNNRPISDFVTAQANYPLENLEVHEKGQPIVVDTAAQSPRAPVAFSRKRATRTSLVIAMATILVTGLGVFAILRNEAVKRSVPAETPRDITLNQSQARAAIPELESTEDSLVVNGDLITKGSIKVVKGSSVLNLNFGDSTSSATVTFPGGSGTLCLDTNNCSFITPVQLAAGLSQIPDSSLINGAIGAVTLQGTENRVSVSTNGGVITLSAPQDLAMLSSPTFANLVITGNVAASALTQSGNTVCDSSNNCGFSSGAGAAFVQGGNSFGAEAILGTNDNQNLSLETNGTTRLTVTAGGNVGIGTTTPAYKLDVAGHTRLGNFYTVYSTIRTIPLAVNDAVDIGTLGSVTNFEITIVVDSLHFIVSKQYFLPATWNNTGGQWKEVLPLASSGPWNNADFALDMLGAADGTKLRLRRTRLSGNPVQQVTGTAHIVIKATQGPAQPAFAESSLVATVTPPSDIYSGASLTQVGGNVGIGTAAPQQALALGSARNFATEMAKPAAPTVTNVGTTGTTSYAYTVTAVDGAGGETVASTATTTTTGNATLDATNYNQVSWTAITGAASYNVYRTASGGTPATTGKIGNTATTSLNDTGLAASGASPTVTTAYVNKLSASGNSWLQGGNVGIGDTVPGAKLQINTGAAGTVGQIIKGASLQTADLLQAQDSTGTNLLRVTAAGVLQGANGSGTDATGSAVTIAGGQGTGTGAGGSLLFQTAATGATGSTLNPLTTRMAIQANGNVGIGTISPGARLDVQNTQTTPANSYGGLITNTLNYGGTATEAFGSGSTLTVTNGNVSYGRGLDGTLRIDNSNGTPGVSLVSAINGRSLFGFAGTSFTAATNNAEIAVFRAEAAAGGGGLTQTYPGTSKFSFFDSIMNSGGGTISVQDAYGLRLTGLGHGSIVTSGTKYAIYSNYGQAFFSTGAAANPGLVVRGFASQTADLLQLQNSSGTVLSKFTAAGALDLTGVGTNSNALMLPGGFLTFAGGGRIWNPDADATLRLDAASGGAMVLNAVAELQVNTSQYGITLTNSAANGLAPLGNSISFTNDIDHTSSSALQVQTNTGTSAITTFKVRPTGSTTIALNRAGETGLVVKGASSQTADLLQAQDSSGTVLAGIASDGRMGVGRAPENNFGFSTRSPSNRIAAFEAPNTRTLFVDSGGVNGFSILANAGFGWEGRYNTAQNAYSLSMSPAYGLIAFSRDTGTTVSDIIRMAYGDKALEVFGLNPGVVTTTIKGTSSQTADLLQAQDSTGAILAKITASGSLEVKNATFNGTITINGHIVSGNTSGSTTVAAGAAACTTPTVSLSGNDTAGTVTVTTGTGCAAGGVLATVTFATGYGVAPRVILTPANAAAAGLQWYTNSSTATTFTLDTNNAPADSTTYKYNYQVMQ